MIENCVINFFMCKRKVSNFFTFVNIFIDNQGKQRNMLTKLNIRCCTYQVKSTFYRTNGVHILTVIDSALRAATVDRDRLR